MTKILLVDDEDALREQIARTLRQRGFEVDEAVDGEDGLERIRAAKGGYALVICDLIMPVLDGMAMLKAAGDSLGGARVMMMSGYEIDAAALEGRTVQTLRKPIGAAAVADEARALLAA